MRVDEIATKNDLIKLELKIQEELLEILKQSNDKYKNIYDFMIEFQEELIQLKYKQEKNEKAE